MHIGKPAHVVVKEGDHVDIGTLIAEQNGPISSPIYSSISGTVTKIRRTLMATGDLILAITVRSDKKETVDPSIAPPAINSAEDLIEAIRACGLVGLGGAGFPTYVKFKVDFSKIDALIINGAECEPYITSDTHTMTKKSDDMAYAFAAIEKYFGIKKIIIGIENNKKEAIESMRLLAKNDPCIEVRVLPSLYPQGGEKVLVYHTTGKVIPAGKLPSDVGCIVCNCTTVAAIGNYLQTGMPLVRKCVTVAGGAVKEPCNVIAPIGTEFSELFKACGGFVCDPEKITYGGPMMGLSVPDCSFQILKNTNAILALDKKEARLPKTTPCIRCGNCTSHCPFGLNPANIALALDQKDTQRLKALRVDVCMECGCCSYICPANRPLVQKNKLAKMLLREESAKEAAKK